MQNLAYVWHTAWAYVGSLNILGTLGPWDTGVPDTLETRLSHVFVTMPNLIVLGRYGMGLEGFQNIGYPLDRDVADRCIC